MGGEPKPERIRDLGLQGAGRCPYCRDLITDAAKVVACAACGARHHEDCRAEHGACAACGASELLVPRDRSTAPPPRSAPPRGSKIQVEELSNGARKLSWPSQGGQALAVWCILVGSMIVTIPLIPLLLLWAWHRKQERSTLILGDHALAIEMVGLFGRKKVTATREDVGAVRLTRNQQQQRLSVDVGVDRIGIGMSGAFPVLKEPEQEWLYEQLTAWKERRG